MRVEFSSAIKGLAIAATVGALGIALTANGGGAPQGQGPFSAVQAAVERNQAQLHKYSWVATTQVSYNGEVKDTKVESVSYGPDGQLQKNVISDTQAPKPPGLRGMIAERKGEDIQHEIESAVALVRSYVPPDPQRLRAAAATVQLLPAPPGEATLVFSNYNLPNDSMTLTFAVEPKSIQTADVSTWLDDPSKPVTLVVQFQTLPDGTDHPALTTLTMPSSHLQVMVNNSDYQQVVF